MLDTFFFQAMPYRIDMYVCLFFIFFQIIAANTFTYLCFVFIDICYTSWLDLKKKNKKNKTNILIYFESKRTVFSKQTIKHTIVLFICTKNVQG